MQFWSYNKKIFTGAKKQYADPMLDVASWTKELEPYQEGAREKTKVQCPCDIPFDFLIPDHIYIFKQSSHRYPAQYWAEIIAFRLGCLMKVPVPPAFVAIDSGRKIAGALIEWFHHYPNHSQEEYIPGGELFRQLNPNYDVKGEQHNLEDLICIMEKKIASENWQTYWAQVFCFDAVIGNTDRHQDNWGLVINNGSYFLAPAFDNGTSLGHELIEERLPKTKKVLEAYILRNKANHHIRQIRGTEEKFHHFKLLEHLIQKYPAMRDSMASCVDFSMDIFCNEIDQLHEISNKLEVSYAKLTKERTSFIVELIHWRQQKIQEILKR